MKKRFFGIMWCLIVYLTISIMMGNAVYADNTPPGPINLTWDNGTISWEVVNPSKVSAVDVTLYNKRDSLDNIFITTRKLSNYQYIDLTEYMIPSETYFFEVRSEYKEQGIYDTKKSAWVRSGEYKAPGSFSLETIENLKFREDTVITWNPSESAYSAEYSTALYEKKDSSWVKVAEKPEIGYGITSYNWGGVYKFEIGKTYKASLVRQQMAGVPVSKTAWTQEFTYAEMYKLCEQPKDVSVYVAEAGSFTVKALGVSKYKWYFYDEMLEEAYNWVEDILPHLNYSDNTKSTFTFRPKDTWLDGRKIYCCLMDESGKVLGYSDYATLHVSVDNRHKHTYTKAEQIASTCKDHGTAEYYTCSCGVNFAEPSEYSDIKEFSKWLNTAGCLELDPANHAGGVKYETTSSTHKVTCKGCGVILQDTESHQDINGDGQCDVCGANTSASGDYYAADIIAPEGGSAPTLVKADGTEYTDICLAWMWNGPGGQYIACNQAFEAWYRSVIGDASFEYMKNNFWVHTFTVGEKYTFMFLKPGSTEVKPLYCNGAMYSTNYSGEFGGVTASIDFICKAHTHTGVKVPQKDPTKDAYGIKEYYRCSCGLYYTDAACKNAIDNLEVWKAGAGRIDKLTDTGDNNVPDVGKEVTDAADNNVPDVGKEVTDAAGNTYVVTKAAVSGKGEVSFKKLKSETAVSVTIPNAVMLNGAQYMVTAIEKSAFVGCKKLTKVVIGKNVNKIKAKAFYKCKRLKSINIKTKKLTLKTVGKKAFAGIHKKAVVKVPKKKFSAYKTLLKKRGLNGKGQKIKK